jgi:hypothetical protein
MLYIYPKVYRRLVLHRTSLSIYCPGMEPSPVLLRSFIGLLYQPWMTDDCGAFGGMNELQGKPKYLEETCPCTALPTTDPTWLDPDRSRAVLVGSRRLTARVTARPLKLAALGLCNCRSLFTGHRVLPCRLRYQQGWNITMNEIWFCIT